MAPRRAPDAALLVLVQVLFGSLSVAGKVAIAQVGPLVLVALRIGVAAVLLLVLERALVGHRPARGDWPLLAGLAVLGVVLNQVLFLVGLSKTTAVEATVLVATIPVFTMGIAVAWGREPWSARKGAGLAVAFAGVVVLVGAGGLEFGTATLVGNLLVAMNALSYSFFLVASRPVLTRVPPLSLTAATFLVGALLTLPLGLLALGDVAPGKPDALGVAVLAYIVLGPTVTTYFLVNHVLVRAAASSVAAFIYIQPLVAAALAVPLLGEPITPRTLAAGALVFLGVALATIQPKGPRRFVPAP